MTAGAATVSAAGAASCGVLSRRASTDSSAPGASSCPGLASKMVPPRLSSVATSAAQEAQSETWQANASAAPSVAAPATYSTRPCSGTWCVGEESGLARGGVILCS